MDNDLPTHNQEETDCHQIAATNPRKPNWLDITNAIILIAAFCAAAAAAYYANKGADASRDQAKAAWTQVADATDTAEKELRSYISIQLAHEIRVESGKINEVRLRIVNVGRTPAYRIALGVKAFQGRPGMVTEWEWTFPPKDEIENKIGYLPADAYHKFKTVDPITADSLVPGQLRLFIVGITYYDDIYDKPHWATFCMWWTRESFAPDKATYCDKYNETDETQPTPPREEPIVLR